MPAWLHRDDLGLKRGTWVHPDLSDSTKLYRYMPIARAVSMFENRSLTLRQPHLWDDPYEKWWCEQLFKPGSKLVDAKAFGLCWTTRDKDEPVWRLYMCPAEPEIPSIRIRTTVAKLCSRVKAHAETHVGKAYLGRVRYTAASELKEIAAELTANPGDHLARNAAQGLHWKRSQFVLEMEVRLLWIMTASTAPDFIELPLEGFDVIDQVRIGPTTSKAKAHSAYDRLHAAGVSKDLLKYSSIYDPVGAPPRRRHTTKKIP